MLANHKGEKAVFPLSRLRLPEGKTVENSRPVRLIDALMYITVFFMD